jgi:hypothetical protein
VSEEFGKMRGDLGYSMRQCGIQGRSALRVHLQDTPQRREQGTVPKRAAMIILNEMGSEEGLGEYCIHGFDALILPSVAESALHAQHI